MSKKGTYEKFKIMDSLLKTMNENISESNKLLENFRKSPNIPDVHYDKDFKHTNTFKASEDYFKTLSSDTALAREALEEIRDFLLDKDSDKRHRDANPNSPENKSPDPPENSQTSGDSKAANIANTVGRILAALGVRELLQRLGRSMDKVMETSYDIQQLSGMGESQTFESKEVVNQLFKGSTIYSSTEEWERLGAIAKSTGYDDVENLALKYTKAIAVGVESMALDTGDLAKTLYTIERRGTFTSAQLESVMDTLYAYSKSGEDVTPEELQTVISASLDGLMYGKDMTEEEYLKELENLSAISSSLLEQKFDANFIAHTTDILSDIYTKGVNSDYWEPLQQAGMNPNDLREMEYSEAFKEVFQGLSEVANIYGDDISGYGETLISGLGYEYNNQYRYLLQNYEDTSELFKEKAAEQPTAEEGAEDYTRSITEVTTTWLDNFFSPVVDFFSKIGVGGSELGFLGGIGTALFGNKLLSAGKGIFSKITGKGATGGGATVAGTGGGATVAGTGAADDVAKGMANSVDDVAKGAAGSIDDVASGAIMTMDDVAKASASASDDVLKGVSTASSALSKAGKALTAVAIVAEGVSTAIDAKEAFDEEDKREGYSEIGEGIGSIGGGLAGAALGSMILPGVGTVIGGIAGSLGGGAAGRFFGGLTYDSTTDYKIFERSDREQLEEYYRETQKLYEEYGSEAAKKFTVSTIVPYLNSLGVSKSITDKYSKDKGYPDFLTDYKDNKFLGYYEQGTPFLPSDGLIYAHKGEAIIPAEYNPANNVSTMRSVTENMVSRNDVLDIYDILVSINSSLSSFIQYFQNRTTVEEFQERVSWSQSRITTTESPVPTNP